MRNNKGFTLIELLAVIVVLAIIALIATPVVLNSISTARTSADKESARGYLKSIEFACAQTLIAGGTPSWATSVSNAKYKGTLPTTTGTFALDANCLATGSGTLNGFTLTQLRT